MLLPPPPAGGQAAKEVIHTHRQEKPLKDVPKSMLHSQDRSAERGAGVTEEAWATSWRGLQPGYGLRQDKGSLRAGSSLRVCVRACVCVCVCECVEGRSTVTLLCGAPRTSPPSRPVQSTHRNAEEGSPLAPCR